MLQCVAACVRNGHGMPNDDSREKLNICRLSCAIIAIADDHTLRDPCCSLVSYQPTFHSQADRTMKRDMHTTLPVPTISNTTVATPNSAHQHVSKVTVHDRVPGTADNNAAVLEGKSCNAPPMRVAPEAELPPSPSAAAPASCTSSPGASSPAVSYTHLTLPTKA